VSPDTEHRDFAKNAQ